MHAGGHEYSRSRSNKQLQSSRFMSPARCVRTHLPHHALRPKMRRLRVWMGARAVKQHVWQEACVARHASVVDVCAAADCCCDQNCSSGSSRHAQLSRVFCRLLPGRIPIMFPSKVSGHEMHVQ